MIGYSRQERGTQKMSRNVLGCAFKRKNDAPHGLSTPAPKFVLNLARRIHTGITGPTRRSHLSIILQRPIYLTSLSSSESMSVQRIYVFLKPARSI